jgi:hypothetical protein
MPFHRRVALIWINCRFPRFLQRACRRGNPACVAPDRLPAGAALPEFWATEVLVGVGNVRVHAVP